MWVSDQVVASIAEGVLQALGASPQSGRIVARSLLRSDHRGTHTHGVSLLPLYAQMIQAGAIDPKASPKSEMISGSLARINGCNAFGQLTAKSAIDTGLAMVAETGVAAVAVRDGAHLGRLGEWAEQACNAGMAFLAFTNTAGGALNVTGPGARGPVLSTNPLAIGIPTYDGLSHDVIVDFATSQVAGSRIREVANAGGKLEPGWVVRRDGSPTVEPDDFLDGIATLLPLGGLCAGHKGFGLTVAGEMLAALAGGLMAGERDTPWFSNGALFCLLDVRRFSSAQEWGERSRRFAEYLQAQGCRLPGAGQSKSSSGDGGQVELSTHVVAGLLELAQDFGVDTLGLTAPSGASSGTVKQTW